MPKSAAQRLAEAEQRMNDRTLSDREREMAAEEFVEAHGELLDKLGVERRGRSTRVGSVIAGLLLIAIIASMAFNVVYSTTASRTANTAQEAVDTIKEVQSENIAAQRESCERTNDAREASIAEKRHDIYFTLRPALKLWKAVVARSGIDPSTPKPVVEKFTDFLAKLERGIHSKQVGIHKALEAIADVAEARGSPRADCSQVVPDNPVAFITQLP